MKKNSKIKIYYEKIEKLNKEKAKIEKDILNLENAIKEELYNLHKKLASKKHLSLFEYVVLLENEDNIVLEDKTNINLENINKDNQKLD